MGGKAPNICTLLIVLPFLQVFPSQYTPPASFFQPSFPQAAGMCTVPPGMSEGSHQPSAATHYSVSSVSSPGPWKIFM